MITNTKMYFHKGNLIDTSGYLVYPKIKRMIDMYLSNPTEEMRDTISKYYSELRESYFLNKDKLDDMEQSKYEILFEIVHKNNILYN